MMKKYDSYKDTGVEWVGEVPEHWQVGRIKNVVKIYGRIGFRGYTVEDIVAEGEGAISLSPSNIYNHQLILDNCTFLSWGKYHESPEIKIYANDIILVKTGSTIGKVAIVPNEHPEMTLNPQLVVLKEVSVNPKFLYYIMSSAGFQTQFDINSAGGSTPAISQEKINNFNFVCPQSFDEQKAIADFLDDKTSQIDSLIQKKQQMIALLEEEKTSVINGAVTKGLNPDAPMKDSGIEWLGMVPAHWEVKRLKYISPKISVGLVINPSTYFEDDGTIPMLTGRNVLPGKIIPKTAKKISEQSNELLSNTKIYENDIVTVRVGFPGTSAVVPKELDGSNCASMVIIRKGNYNSHFISNCFNSKVGKVQTELVEYGAAQRQFNVSHVIEFIFPFPPLKEQDEIVSYLNIKFSKIDKTISRIKEEIQLMQEYRTALISEAVTGKIDVRDYQPEPINSTALA